MTQEAPIDDLDRRIVVGLQTDGRASWTDIAELCSTSVTTVARRGQRLVQDGFVRVAVVPGINHAGPANLYVLRVSCAPGTQTRVASELAQRRDTRLVSLVTGSCDVLAELTVLKQASLSNRLVGEILRIDGVLRCDTDLLLHTYKVSHDWSRQLLTGEAYAYSGEEPHACDPGHFDETDHALLARLKEDGRASFRAVASTLGVNESTVRRRFETLHGRGCVSIVTLVSAAVLGFESEIILQINVEPSRLDSVARKLATYRGMRYVGSTLGMASLMCELILPATDDVFAFVTHTLGQLDGVLGWTASVELVTFKRGFVETPWWRRSVHGELD